MSAIGLWVAELLISDRTAEKVRNLHGLEPEAIRDAVVFRSGLTFGWHNHPDRGRRAIVDVRIDGRDVLVVLYEANHPLGDLATCITWAPHTAFAPRGDTMSNMSTGNDFYEADEPLADVLAAFQAAEKGVTEPHLPPGSAAPRS